jgi:hypothetical protein
MQRGATARLSKPHRGQYFSFTIRCPILGVKYRGASPATLKQLPPNVEFSGGRPGKPSQRGWPSGPPVRWPGSRGALLLPRPLRTGRDRFPSSGSSFGQRTAHATPVPRHPQRRDHASGSKDVASTRTSPTRAASGTVVRESPGHTRAAKARSACGGRTSSVVATCRPIGVAS